MSLVTSPSNRPFLEYLSLLEPRSEEGDAVVSLDDVRDTQHVEEASVDMQLLSKKRALKEKVTVIESSKDRIDLFIHGDLLPFKTKGIQSKIEEVSQAAKEAIQKRLKGILKATIEINICPRNVKVLPCVPHNQLDDCMIEGEPYPYGDDPLELSQFALTALRGAAFRESGAIVELEIKKSVSAVSKTRVVIERLLKNQDPEQPSNPMGLIPEHELPAAYLPISKKQEGTVQLSKSIDGVMVSAISYMPPERYHEKFQWKERAEFGRKISEQIDWSEEVPFTKMKGFLNGRFEFLLPVPNSLKKRVEYAQAEEKILLHTKQPDLVSLGRFYLDSMKGVVFGNAAQCTSLVLKKGYSCESKTVFSIQNMSALKEQEDLQEYMVENRLVDLHL